MLTQEDDVEIHAVAARGWNEAAIARHTGREESVIARLSELSVIPTVELPAPELALPLVEALIGSDLPCLEITFRTEAAFEALSLVKAHHPDVLLAAGTVFSLERAKMAVEAGVEW
jgi:2-dehydro-3-deoxyphosphogluconate aldolase / (4S)-4-hydroxy-2-oxoglutarate aldolase